MSLCLVTNNNIYDLYWYIMYYDSFDGLVGGSMVSIFIEKECSISIIDYKSIWFELHAYRVNGVCGHHVNVIQT